MLTVSPTPETAQYLESLHCDLQKWSERGFKYVTGCGDNLFIHKKDKVWSNDELHLTDDVDFYLTDYELVTE
jgi:hypothetical protein